MKTTPSENVKLMGCGLKYQRIIDAQINVQELLLTSNKLLAHALAAMHGQLWLSC